MPLQQEGDTVLNDLQVKHSLQARIKLSREQSGAWRTIGDITTNVRCAVGSLTVMTTIVSSSVGRNACDVPPLS